MHILKQKSCHWFLLRIIRSDAHLELPVETKNSFYYFISEPNPPVINTCDNQDLYENHMNLRWKEPQVPNGDIIHYIIYMSQTATRTINTDSSTEVHRIENLLPRKFLIKKI